MSHSSRVQIARQHLARIRQSLTGGYWRSCQPEPEPPLDPVRVSRRAELAAAIEQAKSTPRDPDEAERAERLMARLRGEELP